MSTHVGVNIWLAGAFAGVSVNLLVFPLDTLKTRLQSPGFQQTYRSAAAISNRALFRNLYQGASTIFLVTIPSSGIFFSTYEGLKYALGKSSSTAADGFLPQPAVHVLSSSIAQLVNCAIVAPAEVLKQNAQILDARQVASGASRRLSSSPVMTVLRQMKRHPTRLWSGYTALVARDLPYTALQFPVYEYLREVLTARRSRVKKDDGSVVGVYERAWISAVSAGIAGGSAAWVTTPLDVVKTRMMLEAGAKNVAHGEGRRSVQGRRSAFRVGKEVFQKESIRGLFQGGLIRAAFTVVGTGLFFGFYEGAKLYLQVDRENC